MKRPLFLAAIAAILALAVGGIATVSNAQTGKKVPAVTVTDPELDAISEALQARGFVVATPNTASAPREAGSPDATFAATAPLPGGDVRSVEAIVTFDGAGDMPFPTLPAGAEVIGATCYIIEPFNGGDDGLEFTSETIVGGDPAPPVTFARCIDASVEGGGQVQGIPGSGFETDFVPVYSEAEQTVTVGLTTTGTPSAGRAIAQLSYVIVNPGA